MPGSRPPVFLLISLLLTIVIRATIPLGYMPGNLLAGELMVLCPVSSASTLAGLKGQHHHHSHDDSASLEVERQCPIGTALSPIAAAYAFPAILAEYEAVALVLPAAPVLQLRRAYFSFRSRAPPLATV